MRRRSFITLAGGTLPASISRPTQATPSTNRDELILPRDSQVRTGGSRMIDIEGGYRVWTKKVGDTSVKVPLLHGGPGMDHSYFECFEDFLPENCQDRANCPHNRPECPPEDPLYQDMAQTRRNGMQKERA
jgi:proline iminopeptidase